jgi:hypothetical protein
MIVMFMDAALLESAAGVAVSVIVLGEGAVAGA